MYLCIYVFMYVCVYVCMYVICMYVCMYVCLYVCICTYACINEYNNVFLQLIDLGKYSALRFEQESYTEEFFSVSTDYPTTGPPSGVLDGEDGKVRGPRGDTGPRGMFSTCL